MLTLAKVAFAQRFLRAQLVKTAIPGVGLLASAAGGLGRLAGRAGAAFVEKPLTTAMTGLGMYMGGKGVINEVKGGKEKARSWRAGFDPNVQGFQSQQVGTAPGLPAPGQP